MSRIASEALIERSADWGVDTIFGLPGDGINGLMEGLRRHEDRLRFVLVHHEEAAAFMATGYAKSTGRLGVCLATSGPGDPSPERPLRRQARPCPRAGHHRHAGDPDARYRLSAGGEPGKVVHGRGRVQRDDTGTGPDFDSRRPRRASRAQPRAASPTSRCPTDIQVADADANPWEAVAPAVVKPTAPIYIQAPGVPDATTWSERPNAERGRVLSCSSVPAPWERETNCCGWPNYWGARSSRRCPERPRSLTGTRSYLGGIGLLGTVRGGSDRAERHAVHGGDELPLHKAPSRAGPGQGRPGRGRPRPGREPYRYGRPPRRRREKDACRAAASARTARPTRDFLESAQKQMTKWWEKMAALERSKPTRSSRNTWPA